jgi:hypothetical protein
VLGVLCWRRSRRRRRNDKGSIIYYEGLNIFFYFQSE